MQGFAGHEMQTYSSAEIAKRIGIHKDTLLRWLKKGLISEPKRDRHGWRIFTETNVLELMRFANQETSPLSTDESNTKMTPPFSPIEKLRTVDWDFTDAETGYLTHGMHPYPAKFIPQIPNALIQELSSVNETVLDIFCGSGTTLVEALFLKRNCIGIDANPLGCLISRAKTTLLSAQDKEILYRLQEEVNRVLEDQTLGQFSLFAERTPVRAGIPQNDAIDSWFEPFVIEELAILKRLCIQLPTEKARDVALTVFSSIIVSVSKQDSDTRYVRVQKNLKEGDTLKRFSRTLELAIKRSENFSEVVEKKFRCKVINENILDQPNIGAVADLVVCSPPYPNAYSYHLYHRTRMLWLDMDQASFKKQEIGSHRKYSRKGNGRATVETFRTELDTIFSWLSRTLKIGGFACFVIGDSILNGEIVRNDENLIDIANANGYSLEANFSRNIQNTKKSFNPVIGKIRHEHVLVLRNNGGRNV
jgi:site-specific DNA-methyltransferase (cytosine-N4-specific)